MLFERCLYYNNTIIVLEEGLRSHDHPVLACRSMPPTVFCVVLLLQRVLQHTYCTATLCAILSSSPGPSRNEAGRTYIKYYHLWCFDFVCFQYGVQKKKNSWQTTGQYHNSYDNEKRTRWWFKIAETQARNLDPLQPCTWMLDHRDRVRPNTLLQNKCCLVGHDEL